MRSRPILALIVVSLIGITSYSCKQENIDVLKANLDQAIKETNLLESSRLLDSLIKRGVSPETLPVKEVTDLVIMECFDVYEWDPMNGKELVQLYGPIEGLHDGTWMEYVIRGSYFWGLMDIGHRQKALELWKKSEEAMGSLLETPYFLDRAAMPREEIILLQNHRWGFWFFTLGFLSSRRQEDKHRSIELAKKNYDWALRSVKEEVKDTQLSHPVAQAQIMQVLSDNPYALLEYCVVESGLADDASVNPFLEDQPQTDIKFELVKKTGFENCALRLAQGNYNRIALGDYDDDGYVDVLVPGQGLWRNLKGRGKFKQVDKDLGVNIDGQCGALADVNNDGFVDVIVVSPNKFNVSLQTEEKVFKPARSQIETLAENPEAIGLFDGDADGFIDVYIASYESPKEDGGTPDIVLRNNGDGTFQNVTEVWGFKGEDIAQCGRGVSPGDFDNDGRTDIYVSNYRLNRNMLWHNDSDKAGILFIQCAAAPRFGKDKQPGSKEGFDYGIEGRHSVFNEYSLWGHSVGSVWGDLNGDGTLDLVCTNLSHPRFLRRGFSDLSRVYLNTGNAFNDNTLNAGLLFRETNADPMLADFNNDGVLDLSISNAYRIYVNQLYQGVGDGSFKEVTFHTGAFGCNAMGQASGDFDNDGDLDWFVCDGNKGLLLYENKLIDGGKIPETANWIQIKLNGSSHVNSMAYGARVTVKAKDKIYVREVAGMRGASNCDDQVVHVGLGNYTGNVDVEIRWIGDKVQKIDGLEINKHHIIKESDKE